MVASLRGAGGRDAVALLVALESDAANRFVRSLGERGLTPMQVQSFGDVAKVLHFRNVEVVVAQAKPATAFAALCESCSDLPVIAVSTGGDPSAGEPALRAGAVAVVSDVTDAAEIGLALDRSLASQEALPGTEEPPPAASMQSRLLGDSAPMQRVADLVGRTASSLATALVRGETGTGKELVARALHDQSPRKDGPFIKVHCAALPDALLESELFGYEKGAFTGAAARKPGRVELAQGGTLFLDEIGDITPAVQVKLLRLLQDKQFERLGGLRPLQADVRFVAATHRDLDSMVRSGDFRADLFYRLNVVTLWLPPLRARRDDITILARAFAGEFARAHDKPDVHLEQSAIDTLRAERWPGNVRQLQNFVERLVVLAQGPITEDDVRREMTEHIRFETQLTGVRPSARARTSGSVGPAAPEPAPVLLEEAVRTAEREAIERALRFANGNRTVAARILGVSRATLYTKLDEHQLS
jgi:two-component system response regulator AtoC